MKKNLKNIILIIIAVSFFILIMLNAFCFNNNQNKIKTCYAYSKNINFEENSDQVEYLRVIDSTTPFYSDNEGNELVFYLPYTYYVKVIEKGNILTHIEYGENNLTTIDGYVPTSMLYKDNLNVDDPYLNKKIEIANNTSLFSDKNCLNNINFIYSNRYAYYYGCIQNENNEFLLYIKYNNKIGYIKESDVVPFNIENQANELSFIKKPDNEESTSDVINTNDKTTINLRIIIISSLIIAGIIALIISFRKKPKPHKDSSYYDENDYE